MGLTEKQTVIAISRATRDRVKRLRAQLRASNYDNVDMTYNEVIEQLLEEHEIVQKLRNRKYDKGMQDLIDKYLHPEPDNEYDTREAYSSK